MAVNKRKCYVGDKYVLTCGVEVEVVEYLDCFNIMIQDSKGTTKVVGSSELVRGYISWGEQPDTLIGRKFLLNCGVEVIVIERNSKGKVRVQDSLGNTKVCSVSQLKSGAVSWRKFGWPSFKNSTTNPVRIGDSIELNSGVTVTVVDRTGIDTITVRDATGNEKVTSANQLRKGTVSWREFGVPTKTKIFQRLSVGDIRESRQGGKFEILDIQSATDITIKWLDTGSVQEGNSIYSIEGGSLTNTTSSKEILYTTANMYYVYLVVQDMEVVYVGKGIGNRYTHVHSGTSHKYEFNQAHFLNIPLEVVIYKDNLEESAALLLETELIEYYNSKLNRQKMTYRVS